MLRGAQPRAARKSLEAALAVQERLLGPDAATTALTRSELGNVLIAYRELEDARRELDRALPVLEAELGPVDPETVSAAYRLARVLDFAGSTDEAVALLQRTIATLEERLGPDHPLLARGLLRLATIYRLEERLDEAIPLLQRAERVTIAALGPQHPDVGDIFTELAVGFQHAGEPRVGGRLLSPGARQHGADRRARSSGHHRGGLRVRPLPARYRPPGAAIPKLARTLDHLERAGDEGSPNLIGLLEALATSYGEVGDLRPGLDVLDKLVAIRGQRAETVDAGALRRDLETAIAWATRLEDEAAAERYRGMLRGMPSDPGALP